VTLSRISAPGRNGGQRAGFIGIGLSSFSPSATREDVKRSAFFPKPTLFETKRGIRSGVAENPVLGGLQTLLRRSVLLRVPDLEDDLAGLVGCARQHGLRLARLGKRQD